MRLYAHPDVVLATMPSAPVHTTQRVEKNDEGAGQDECAGEDGGWGKVCGQKKMKVIGCLIGYAQHNAMHSMGS